MWTRDNQGWAVLGCTPPDAIVTQKGRESRFKPLICHCCWVGSKSKVMWISHTLFPTQISGSMSTYTLAWVNLLKYPPSPIVPFNEATVSERRLGRCHDKMLFKNKRKVVRNTLPSFMQKNKIRISFSPETKKKHTQKKKKTHRVVGISVSFYGKPPLFVWFCSSPHLPSSLQRLSKTSDTSPRSFASGGAAWLAWPVMICDDLLLGSAGDPTRSNSCAFLFGFSRLSMKGMNQRDLVLWIFKSP